MATTVGRNAACPCGSGKKYKRCCALKRAKSSFSTRLVASLIGLMLLVGAVLMFTSLSQPGDGTRQRVWSEEHGHWHYE